MNFQSKNIFQIVSIMKMKKAKKLAEIFINYYYLLIARVKLYFYLTMIYF